jgi:N-acetyl-gamma-glutamyl-phosphate reductase
MSAHSLRAGVLGASGFTGGELVRLLGAHPNVKLAYLGGESASGRSLANVHPHLARTPEAGNVLGPVDADAATDEADLAFLALPRGSAARLAPALLEAGTRVVDLSGDHRLPAALYPEWYGFERDGAWLDKAVYGLPELFGDQIAGADLVANPGCFPTPVALGLAPLLLAGLIGGGPIVVDGKTGVSGAGRAATDATTFAASDESVRPYRAPRHQHTPEMEHALQLATGVDVAVSFVPHLVPMARGVLVTCSAPLSSDVTTTQALTEALADAYTGAPFVCVLAPGDMADTKRTRGSNLVELQAFADQRAGLAVVIGAIDNLVKGGAGQAIQNMNLMAGFDETTALSVTGVYP